MAAGLPISLLPLPEYRERSEQVRALFATPNAGEAAAIAHRLRLDYLYVDRDDVAAYPRRAEVRRRTRSGSSACSPMTKCESTR